MTIINTLPYLLQNGATADATQVDANFAQILANVNANAAGSGVNADITQLTAINTPPGSLAALVFDALTTTGSTANAVVLPTTLPGGFSLRKGNRVTFVAAAANTGATYANVNNTGLLQIYKPTTAGMTALAGGEILVGQAYELYYDGTQYQFFTPAAIAPTLLLPTGMVSAFASTPPSGFLYCNGSTFSGTTYPALAAYLGSTTLPDYRGVFLRALDDGKGLNPATQAIGAYLADQLQDHTHTVVTQASNNYIVVGSNPETAPNYATTTLTTSVPNSGNHGVETRPKSITVYYGIKT